MYLKRIFILVLVISTMPSFVQASWAAKLANGLRHTATWGLPALGIGGSVYFKNYPDHSGTLLKKIGALQDPQTYEELSSKILFSTSVSFLNNKQNTTPIYFVPKDFREEEGKRVKLTGFGWILSGDFNDLVCKNPESIDSDEKAARLYMNIKYSQWCYDHGGQKYYERVLPVVTLATLQHTLQKYALNNFQICSWLKKPITSSQKILAPIAIGILGIANCYAQIKTINQIVTLKQNKNVQAFIDQLHDAEKEFLPSFARMSDELNYEEKDVLKKAVEETEQKN